MTKGWKSESARHSLARKGIETGIKPSGAKASYKQVVPKPNETLFQVNPRISVLCRWEKTRNGFRHVADLYVNGLYKESAKINYLNRTWEAFDYQSVLQKVIETAGVLSDEEKKQGMQYTKDYEDVEKRRVEKEFGQIGKIAKLGDVFGQTLKESNDWKLRMIKAGLENKGLQIPEDWDKLDEETKKARLDGLIKMMGEKEK